MKKIFALLITTSVVSSIFAQQQLPGLSPLTKKYLHDLQQAQPATANTQDLVFKKAADGRLVVSAIIKVADAAKAMKYLSAIGAQVGTKAGPIWTIQVPEEKIPELTASPGISYIQLDEPVHPHMNIARQTTLADSVQLGTGLSIPYSGKDVVVGVIDFGFDYNHPAFSDTLGGKFRIKKVWELNGTGTPPAGYTYGNEITDSVAIKARGTDNPQQMHGTGVAGIAAGSGYGSPGNKRFRGMAYEADLVFVGVRRDSIEKQWLQGGFSDFIDGISYIFKYADEVHKPAVVNISWGSQSGPHDGSSLFNQACDHLAGPGKIIVMSAGNEGEEKIHLSKTFTATDSLLATFLDFTPATYKRTWVDIWGDSTKTFCASVTLYKNGVTGNTTGFTCIDNQVHDRVLMGANQIDSCLVQFITASAEFNGRPRLTVNIFNKAADSIAVSIKGNDGSIHAWNEYYYYGYTNGYLSDFNSHGYPWAQTGNTVSTVSDMGSAQSVLLVGAYSSKNGWNDINGNPWSYSGYVQAGNIVPFSSRGPMIDGRIKPDIAAPGLTLATATSSYDTKSTATGSNSSKVINVYTQPITNKKYYYAEFIGTSASSPAASGIVALMLQADPALSPLQVKNILARTAITDNLTGSIPATGNNIWGHGKINAYGAVKQSIQQAGLYRFTGKKIDCVLYPNPGNGFMTIDYSTDREQMLDIEVMDMNGSTVYTEKTWRTAAGINQYQLDLSAMPKGLYVVKASSGEGTAIMKAWIR